MFIDKKDLALALVLAPVAIGCAGKESTAPVSSILPTSTSVSETATSTPIATPPPPEPPNTPTTEPTSTPISRTTTSQYPEGAVFSNDLLPKKGGIAFYHRNGEIVMAIGVKQDCTDGNPLKMSVVMISNPGEVNGLVLNRRWSNIGSINVRFMEAQNSVSGFLRLNQAGERNCPPAEFEILAPYKGKGTETFLESYNAVMGSINVLPVPTVNALEDINKACTKCKLISEGK